MRRGCLGRGGGAGVGLLSPALVKLLLHLLASGLLLAVGLLEVLEVWLLQFWLVKFLLL